LSNASALTEIVWDNALAPALVVAHRHPLAAASTKDQALQERWPFPWRGKTLRSIGLTVQSKLCLISLKVFPTNVPYMSVTYKDYPVGTGNVLDVELAISSLGGAGAPVDIGSCIGWMM
jgi:hypothetical protein